MTYYTDQQNWLQKAESLIPVLITTEKRPSHLVSVVPDPSGFQGWTAVNSAPVESILGQILDRKAEFIVDFDEHVVGQLRLTIGLGGNVADAPLRLRLVFGEVVAEVAEPFDPYPGTLSRSWLQDEIVTIDVLPATIILPRRYAFRYLKIQVIDTSPWYTIHIDDIVCLAVSSADSRALSPTSEQLDTSYRELDRVSLRTLSNCMQTVFEDGPKRDRRLWIGDLRLQALTNYASFKNNDLVKRCLYLFAGLANDTGAIPANVYETPVPHGGNEILYDYSALYPVVLADYYRASADRDTATDLWPAAKRQLEIVLQFVNKEGVFNDPGNIWLLVDWCKPLDRQASLQSIIIYALRHAVIFAQSIDQPGDAQEFAKKISIMEKAARENFYDAENNLCVSGTAKQVSWASWAWMTLAGVLTADEAVRSFLALKKSHDPILPQGPYLYHHVVEALFMCGLVDHATAILEKYWGGMLDKGATTFWEVYNPDDDFLSPYNSHLINSYCHAWSCTPSYFIRTKLMGDKQKKVGGGFDLLLATLSKAHIDP